MYRPCFLFLCNAQKSKKNNEGVEARSDDVMLKVGAAVTPDVDENRDEDVASLPKLTFDENNETSEKNIDNVVPYRYRYRYRYLIHYFHLQTVPYGKI